MIVVDRDAITHATGPALVLDTVRAALITHALARPDADTLAVFGTGEQARLQATWLAHLRPLREGLVHGRDPRKARALCTALGPSARPVSAADMIVTTTASTTPVLDAALVREGAHVTGIGADMPHKNELPAALFARAALIATDDHTQCLHHAVRAGAVPDHSDTPVGLLLDEPVHRSDTAIGDFGTRRTVPASSTVGHQVYDKVEFRFEPGWVARRDRQASPVDGPRARRVTTDATRSG